MQLEWEKLDISGFEEVYRIDERQVGLTAIIAIHSTAMGPAVGGLRIYPYPSFQEALDDVLKLAKGMTYKALMAGAKLGGGKAVIIKDPAKPISHALLDAFAEAVNALSGRYYTAEDSGVSPNELLHIRKTTPYIVGLELEGSSGNPCPATAYGTVRAIESTLAFLSGNSSLEGKTVAIQGVGAVGMLLAEYLFWRGASLIVSDLREERTKLAKERFGAEVVSLDAIYRAECDIFSPCAMGGILRDETIRKLRCKAVVGSANNQLSRPEDALLLEEMNILYAPDYVVNAGGLINVQYELLPGGYDPIHARDSVLQIYERITQVFSLAKERGCTSDKAAFLIATSEYNLAKASPS